MKHLTLLVALGAVAGACGGSHGAAEEDPANQPAAATRTATVGIQSISQVINAVGTVTPQPGHFAVLAPPAPTRVSAIHVSPGQRVAKGDTLVELERAPFDAAARSAQVALDIAERAYARAERLVQAGILPQKDRDQASAELEQARLNAVLAARAQELATLRAPLSGVVTSMTAVLGASVDPSQPLVEIADPSAVDIVFNVSAAEAAEIRPGTAVTIAAGQSSESVLGEGQVISVGAAVDSLSRAVQVRTRLAHPARALRIGESVAGRIVVAVRDKAITVPVDAIVPSDSGYLVFVVDNAGIAHARAVTVGTRTQTMAEIMSGLTPGEIVVTTGAYGVTEGAKVTR